LFLVLAITGRMCAGHMPALLWDNFEVFRPAMQYTAPKGMTYGYYSKPNFWCQGVGPKTGNFMYLQNIKAHRGISRAQFV